MNAPRTPAVQRGNNFLRADPRPKMRLLAWAPINRGALIGRARVLLSPGLEVSDVAVFEKDGRQWAQFPSEPMRDLAGAPLTDANGRARYRSSMKWASRELQERFATALIQLIRQRYPEAFDRGAGDAEDRQRDPEALA